VARRNGFSVLVQAVRGGDVEAVQDELEKLTAQGRGRNGGYHGRLRREVRNQMTKADNASVIAVLEQFYRDIPSGTGTRTPGTKRRTRRGVLAPS